MMDETDIDLLPPVFVSEDYLYAMLLDTIKEACTTQTNGELKSCARASYARALRELESSGFLDIRSEDGDDVTATITAKGNAYIARLIEG